MFAMQEDEVGVAIMFIIGMFGFIITAVVMGHRSKDRRLMLIERALREGTLDEPTRRAVSEELTGRRIRDPDAPTWRRSLSKQIALVSRNSLFVLGWLTLFTGIGLMVTGDDELLRAGGIVSCIGFGVVTVPLALRELEARGETRGGTHRG